MLKMLGCTSNAQPWNTRTNMFFIIVYIREGRRGRQGHLQPSRLRKGSDWQWKRAKRIQNRNQSPAQAKPPQTGPGVAQCRPNPGPPVSPSCIIGIHVCKHTRAGANSHMVGCDGAPTADTPKAVKPRKKDDNTIQDHTMKG